MSLRRSARVQAKPAASADLFNGPVTAIPTAPSKKRGRRAKISHDIQSDTVEQQNITNGSSSIAPPPTTPNKRRRVANSTPNPPPLTPTPSAVNLMISNSVLRPNCSSGDIDDAISLPPDRPAEPHHTNATLVTPGGTQVQRTYLSVREEEPSRYRPDAIANMTTTAACLLDTACAHLLKVDPRLKTVIELHPCRLFSPQGLAEEVDPFRSLASGIIAQQVSGAAAKSIKNKFVALFDAKDCPTGFPPPALVADMPLPRLREAGLSQRKAEYISGLAQKFRDGELTVDMLLHGSDEEVMQHLVAVRGLGVWSVEMFMCFGLKRMDVFSTGDLGVQRGMAAYLGKDVSKLKAKGGGKWKYMSEREMLETAERFRPYRSLFMWYMWRIESVDVSVMGES